VKGLYNVKNTGTWKELNRVIMDPQTTFRLRSFTIVVDIISQSRPAQIMDEPLKLTEVEAVIRREMSWCDSRGIVRIVPDTRIEDSKKG
jgi:restriction endonuclease